MQVLISGGGIGGLTAALCLRAIGAKVQIFETSPKLSEIGAGIQLSPNAMRVYDKLGLSEALAERAFTPQALEMRYGISGAKIFSTRLTPHRLKTWGSAYLHLHRADVIDALANAVAADPGITLHLARTIVGYKHRPCGVDVAFAEGGYVRGDVLIGADGIHSLIRRQMLGAHKPRFTGNVAWRAVVATENLGADAPPPTACVWVGKKRHAVTYRLRGGRLSNFVGVVERDDWADESWVAQGKRDDVLADFAGWHKSIITLIEQADNHFHWALYDRDPLPNWADGAVALLGDACHPTLPFMAQGAALAIEDAQYLARCLQDLGSHADIPSALQRYYGGRIARTSKVQAISRRNMKLFHRAHPWGRLTTYMPMALAGRFAPGIIESQQTPIYGYDVTAARLPSTEFSAQAGR